MEEHKGYVHGYSEEEQERLYRQARYLEPKVFEHIDFSTLEKVLEVGCGVGAQTEILLRRFPQLYIYGIDASALQISKAQEMLLKFPHTQGKFSLSMEDAYTFRSSEPFDGAFICWVLEHISSPDLLLKNISNALKNNGLLHITEVVNSSLLIEPPLPTFMKIWNIFIKLQYQLGGNPNVGLKLYKLLKDAGYSNIQVEPRILHYDCRNSEELKALFEYWGELTFSAVPELMKHGLVTEQELDCAKNELTEASQDPNTVFYYTFVQATAQKIL